MTNAEGEPLVVCRPDVVAIEADGRVVGIRLHELRLRDRRIADRGRAWNDAEVRVGYPLEQRRPERQLCLRQLIDVAVRDADIRDLRSEVRNFDGCVRRQLALDRRVPLLRVARPEAAVNGEDALSEPRGRRWRDRCDRGARRQHERWRDVVERAERHVL